MTGTSVDNNIFSCKTKLQRNVVKINVLLVLKKRVIQTFQINGKTQSIIYYLLSRDPEYRICIET